MVLVITGLRGLIYTSEILHGPFLSYGSVSVMMSSSGNDVSVDMGGANDQRQGAGYLPGDQTEWLLSPQCVHTALLTSIRVMWALLWVVSMPDFQGS